jgi:peptidoglycan/xylan/chitin deacetylase (PgdA/CDA1 family)
MLLLAALLCCLPAAAQRSVAITIDDLPVAQSGPQACDFDRLVPLTSRLLAPIRKDRIPVTAFVIAGNCPKLTPEQRRQVLRTWIHAGVELGNHTYSHHDFNSTSAGDFEQDILRAEPVIKDANGGQPIRYFRFPMLHTGPDAATKKRLADFLAQHGYRQAVVTFDNSDWMFSYVYTGALARGDNALANRTRDAYIPYMESVVAFFEKRAVEVAGREFPQILLMHANQLNSEMFPALLDMFRRRGYRFVSLDQALADTVYQLPETYAGPGGFSWIHRWSKTKGMANKGEPDEPDWIREAFQRLQH